MPGGGWALSQLWLFWVAPILGAIVGAVISTRFFAAPQESVREAMAKDH
jgi:aquaporin Z